MPSALPLLSCGSGADSPWEALKSFVVSFRQQSKLGCKPFCRLLPHTTRPPSDHALVAISWSPRLRPPNPATLASPPAHLSPLGDFSLAQRLLGSVRLPCTACLITAHYCIRTSRIQPGRIAPKYGETSSLQPLQACRARVAQPHRTALVREPKKQYFG